MIRWGMVGCGRICHRIMDGFHRVDSAEVTAVYNRSCHKAETFAKQYGIPLTFEHFEEFLESRAFDVVYLAVPHTEHMEYAIRCMEAGLPVVCEKPLAPSASQARKMVEAAKKHRVFLMEAMWTRMFPVTQQVCRWLPEIGKITAIQGSFGFCADHSNEQDRLFSLDTAGGALLDIGIYLLNYLSMVMGSQPDEIVSLASVGKTGCDESSGMVFRYVGGEIANLLISFEAELRDMVTIYGSCGRITVPPDFWRPKRAVLEIGDKRETVEDPTQGEGFQYEILHVGKCLEKGKLESELMPLQESVAVLETADRIRRLWGLRYPFES